MADKRVDRNFAISLPVLDMPFGTIHSPKGEWPKGYGLSRDPLEVRYLVHLLAPFRGQAERSSP